MATVVLWGAEYSDVPAITVPSTGGTTVTFYEAIDGNSIEYGITDGTLPLVGVAKAGYADI